MRQLTLTSPLMHGPDVRELQRLLGRNPFGSFIHEAPDSQFGPMTDQACTHAKYWLGFPASGPNRWQNGGAGERLRSFLAGERQLPKDFAKRRAQRVREAPKKKLRERALEVALEEARERVREDPFGSNNVRYSRWYTNNPKGWQGQDVGPRWCAMFVTWCYAKVDSQAFDKDAARYAFCPFVHADASRGRHFLTITRDPQPGDVSLYTFGKSQDQHIGIFVRWTDRNAGAFRAVEGNTGVGDDANGGQVMERDRSLRDGVTFVHVGK
jgi:hypothetical protein